MAVCRQCGLSYSRYADVPYTRDPRPSGDADWGNIRWAKGFRLDALRPQLTGLVRDGKMSRVLDVGANRGSFLEWLLEQCPDTKFTAVEPDERVVTTYRDRPEIDIRLAKLEHTTLEPDAYDFAYCCQTLEHADSPASMIASMHSALKVGRVMFIEVPNIEVISYPLTVEEFFIDKHTTHFGHRLLTSYVEWSGFRLEEGTNPADDILNVRIVATKIGPQIDGPLDYLRCSIYANDQEAHEKFTGTKVRIETVFENLKRLREMRDAQGATRPYIYVKMFETISPDEEQHFRDKFKDVGDEITLEMLHNMTASTTSRTTWASMCPSTRPSASARRRSTCRRWRPTATSPSAASTGAGRPRSAT